MPAKSGTGSAQAKPLAQEWHGSRLVQQWGGAAACSGASRATPAAWVADMLTKTFMPEGYPESVSSDYLGEYCTDVHTGFACMSSRAWLIAALQ